MELTKKEQDILRELGKRYMEHASLPLQREKMNLWKALNRCEMQRPMVVIDQVPWNELEAGEWLRPVVQDPYWRGVETQLRRTVYQWENFPADMVLEPYIVVPANLYTKEYGIDLEVERRVLHENETASSQHYSAVIKHEEDIPKIKDIEIVYDREDSLLKLEQAAVLFDGIAPVKLQHGLQFHLGVWDHLAMCLGGVEGIYFDFIERPEFLHAAMRRITDATLAGIAEANRLGIHNDIVNTCHCSYTYTDELLPDFGAGKGPYSKNSWAFGLAQLFTSVSPAMFEEFEIPYITEMAEQFGMVYYGCCDRLDDRLDMVKTIPNVKKVSCSPWSNRENFAENIGKGLVMSNKPTPALLAGETFDEEAVREDLLRTCRCARKNGVNLELILKDISTVRFDPSRLNRWSQVAIEIVENM